MNQVWKTTLLVPCLIVALTGASRGQGKIFGGLSVPVGEFASTDSVTGGFAKLGFALGAEIIGKFYFGSEIGFSGLVDYHPIDDHRFLSAQPDMPSGELSQVSGWIQIWPMASLGYPLQPILSIPAYVRVHGGVLFGISPGMTVDHSGTKFTQNPAFKITTAWGAEIGVTGFEKFNIGVRYMNAEPEYDINVLGGGKSLEKRSKYTTNIVQVLVGVIL